MTDAMFTALIRAALVVFALGMTTLIALLMCITDDHPHRATRPEATTTQPNHQEPPRA